jgi:hypothetical protein
MYGLDMLLYNGKKYFSEINPVQGHPFWRSPNGFVGDIYLNGKVFRNNQLKYNLITQQFVLSYYDSKSREEHHPIVLINALIDSIRTSDILFVKNHFPEIPQDFIREVHRGRISCFMALRKEIFEKVKGYDIRKAISEEKRDYYLFLSSKVHPFHSPSTFREAFPKQNQKVIKKYISANKVKFKEIDDSELKRLIVFCETVLK